MSLDKMASELSQKVGIPEKVAKGAMYAAGGLVVGLILGPVGLAVGGVIQGVSEAYNEKKLEKTDSKDEKIAKVGGWSLALFLTDGLFGAAAFTGASYFSKLIAKKAFEYQENKENGPKSTRKFSM